MRVLEETGLTNNYILTKYMTELMLSELHSPSFKVAIVRPSIIGPTAYNPQPGYFGNSAGLTASILAFASGVQHQPQQLLSCWYHTSTHPSCQASHCCAPHTCAGEAHQHGLLHVGGRAEVNPISERMLVPRSC